MNATKETQSKHASRKMLSVLTGSFDKTEKLAPSSQQVCLTFLLKKFFELSEIDSAESKNKKSAFFLSKNRSMNYPDGCIVSQCKHFITKKKLFCSKNNYCPALLGGAHTYFVVLLWLITFGIPPIILCGYSLINDVFSAFLIDLLPADNKWFLLGTKWGW